MKINSITVEKLFGVFNHKIPFNNNTGITIIIGENGLGKTVLLEMIEAFFKGKYFYFTNVDFEEFIIEFEDGIFWTLRKYINNQGSPLLSLTQTNKNKTEYKPISLVSYNTAEINRLAIRIGRSIMSLRRVEKYLWVDKHTGESFSSSGLIEKYGHLFSDDLLISEDEKPKWFLERHSKINISLIETQRLISHQINEEKHIETSVEKYSKELSQTIKTYLTTSTELSSKLDRTYPNRLISRLKQSSNTTEAHLRNELQRLEKKRKQLDRVGLIELENVSSIFKFDDSKDQNLIIDVLMLYVEDSFEKVKIFDTISNKIELFLKIINKRFKHKKLIADKERGFWFKSTIIKNEKGEYQTIPVSKLSSGEQNELVLFYLLLFKTSKDSVILIDEPEVSLHISWQNSFIQDLKEITELTQLDIVIATHSPDIIAENWDLSVELKGLE